MSANDPALLYPEPGAVPAADGRPIRRRTVADRNFRRLQHVHTLVMTGAGLAGLIGAILLHVFFRPISRPAIAVFFFFFFLVGMGLTIGYHRFFTHQSFRTSTAFKTALGILGSMAGQGPVVFWTALHRMHHELADKEGDPHSPNMHGDGIWNKTRGLFHAYIGWTVKHEVPNANFYARDLLVDAPIMWINGTYYVWIILGLLLPAAIVGAYEVSAYGFLEGFLWGGLVRMFALHNMIWWITSFAHVFGTRDYTSRDLSTNNFWLAVPTLGESWHNTHHAFPRAAILSLQWWQIDISGAVVALLEQAGIVWDVCRIRERDRDVRAVHPPETV